MSGLTPDLKSAIDRAEPRVLVTIARVKGSSPRAAGTKMVVWQDGFSGTIGGGNLEHVTLAKARGLLAAGHEAKPLLTEVPLGPSLGQCCGGSVLLLFEPMSGGPPPWAAAMERDEPAVLVTTIGPGGTEKMVLTSDTLAGADLDGSVKRTIGQLLEADKAGCRLVKKAKGENFLLEALVDRDPVVLLFGAGHTGRALAPLLAGLPFQVTWVDERPTEFPDELPAGVRVRPVAQPQAEVDQAPPGALYLVMTHSHQRDLELCARVMSRGDFAYLGLIGSATKRARFEHRLRESGLDDAVIDRLTCPIGIAGISGKEPAEIAVSVAAQLLRIRDRALREPES